MEGLVARERVLPTRLKPVNVLSKTTSLSIHGVTLVVVAVVQNRQPANLQKVSLGGPFCKPQVRRRFGVNGVLQASNRPEMRVGDGSAHPDQVKTFMCRVPLLHLRFLTAFSPLLSMTWEKARSNVAPRPN
jgi:hypothetical protein